MVRGMEISNSKDEPDTPTLCTSCIHSKMIWMVIPKTTDAIHPCLLFHIIQTSVDLCEWHHTLATAIFPPSQTANPITSLYTYKKPKIKHSMYLRLMSLELKS
jgi:hypothetical protein